MKTIYIYTGQGAYQAKDVENFLAVFEYDYNRIDESELNQLTLNDILIAPGGEISTYLPTIGAKGIEAIQKFVNSGGVYIGICAGVYIAGSSYDDTPGLNFFPQILAGNKTQATINVTDETGTKFQLINENGPDLSVIKADRVILKDSANNPQAVIINYGQGQVYLFAAHPEGSVYYELPPQNFTGAKYFKNLINQLIGS